MKPNPQAAGEVEADYKRAAEFVFSVTQPVNLVSIDPTGASPPRPQTFKRSGSAAKWMATEQAARRNLYYQDCGLSVINKRPKKNDVTIVLCAHVDAEVQPKDTPSGPEFDRKRAALLHKLRNWHLPPSVIIDSGNGYQAFWYLANPLKATDDVIRRIEAVNLYLRGEFGGDACQDVAHLLRVPYTRNFPNAVKIKLGRSECVSSILEDDRWLDVTYPLDALPAHKAEDTASEEMSGDEEIPDIPDKVDLHRLPDKIRRMIEKGSAGSRQIGDGTRSDLIYHIACEMRRREYSDGEILATITNPDFEISSHYQDNPQREILNQAWRVILRMNADGVVADADRRWLWDEECQIVITPASFVDKTTRELLSKASFDLRYDHLLPLKTEASTVARHSRHMERFSGLCYRPNAKRDLSPVERKGRRLFNTWQPQDIEPLEGEPTLFLHHCEYLIADEAAREVFYDWLAHLVQHPERKARWAVVLFGPQGTGKSWLAEVLKMIFGERNCSEPPINQITSDFNSWLAEKKLVIIHEAKRETRVGKLTDYLKDIIVQPTTRLNRKGIEAVPIENLADFLLITNEDDAIDIDPAERRYFVIVCADLPKGAKPAPGHEPPYIRTKDMDDYYDKLFGGMSDEEIAANVPTSECRRLLGWLLKRKGGNVKLPPMAPPTVARSDMIDANRSDLARWLRERYIDREWPFATPLFHVPTVLDQLPATVPPKERTQRSIEIACRKLGCAALGGAALRIGDERVRLWARTRAEAADIKDWTPDQIATAYQAFKSKVRQPTAADDFGGDEEEFVE